jgi:hypothetical protein
MKFMISDLVCRMHFWNIRDPSSGALAIIRLESQIIKKKKTSLAVRNFHILLPSLLKNDAT